MDIYILSPQFLRLRPIDEYISLIWTERFKAVGDFELIIAASSQFRGALTIGTYLGIKESYRVMQIETIEDETAEDGTSTVNIKGRSLEKVLDGRVAAANLDSLTSDSKWTFTTMLPKAIVEKMFHDVCVTGVLGGSDVINNIHEGSLFPADTIPAPSEAITWEVSPKTLLEAITELCDIYDMGFSLLKNGDTSQLWFSVYMGSDRTTGQTQYPAVIFSQAFDNLKNTKELVTTENEKNCALVISPTDSILVYPAEVDPASAVSLDRKVLLVDANDVTATTGLTAILQTRGRAALAEYRAFRAFDGEITQLSAYVYGKNYFLGDLIEVRNKIGEMNKMKVVEQIFVSDAEGVRSYPTLQLNSFITAGAWISWDFATKVWLDYEEPGIPEPEQTHWEDLP